MKNARLLPSERMSTTAMLPIFGLVGFIVIWLSTVGPLLLVLVVWVVLVALLEPEPPPLTRTITTTTAATITANSAAPPTRELGSERALDALAVLAGGRSGDSLDAGAGLTALSLVVAESSCTRWGSGAPAPAPASVPAPGISGISPPASGASAAA